jgi:hypothetical protein
MADVTPEIELGLGEQETPVVLIGPDGSQSEAADMSGLLNLVPGLASPDHAADLARAVNHFAHASEYRIIDDPAAFAAAYQAQIAREDPNVEWQEGVIRLIDYGVPDFAEIQPPVFEGGKLVFYAVDVFLGLPYRVKTPELTAAPDYEPMELTPLPAPPQPKSKPAERSHTPIPKPEAPAPMPMPMPTRQGEPS